MAERRSLPLIGAVCPRCYATICEVTGPPHHPERIIPPCGCRLTSQTDINMITIPIGEGAARG